MKISENMKKYLEEESKYLSTGVTPAFTLAPRVFKFGKGVKIYDTDGNEYYDFSAGVLTNAAGHSHPKIIEFMKERIGEVWNIYDYSTPYRLDLLKGLDAITPEQINTFEFYSTGSEAVEAGLRALYSYMPQERKKLCTIVGGFHGKTGGSRRLIEWKLEGELHDEVYRIHYPHCYRCAFEKKKGDCNKECLEHAVKTLSENDDIGALVLEPILGSGGAIKPTQEYMDTISRICKEKEILIYADEFCLGFGRSGKDFAFQHYNLLPDLMVFSKGLASGFPFSVLGGRKEIMNKKPFGLPGRASSTFGGNPLGIAAAYITLQVYHEENLCQNAADLGVLLEEWLKKMKKKYQYIGDVNSAGLYCAIDFVKDRESREKNDELGFEVHKQCTNNGVKTMAFNNLFKLAPPLIVTKEELEDALHRIDNAIETAIEIVYGTGK